MQTHRVNLRNQKEVIEFINFPFRIYHKNPYWVPAMWSEMELVMHPDRHPFYRHSNADFFVIKSGRDLLGRIAVLNHRNYNLHHAARAGFFYYFDAVNDPEVSRLLFTAAFDWCKSNDLDSIYGAKGFSRSNGIGVLIEGFDYHPAMGIPYNYPYYPALIERSGFEKETDYLSGYLDSGLQVSDRMEQVAQRLKSSGRFSIKSFSSKKEMLDWVPRVNAVHQAAFENNPGFMPSTEEEFKLIATSMVKVAAPGMINLIMAGDDVAGFMVSYPNVNDAIRKSGGKLWPFGWIHFINAKRNTRIADMNGIGILPRFQGMGANILLYTDLIHTFKRFPFDRAELIQVDERNFKSKSDMENLGVTWYKRHRLYKRLL